MIDHYLEHLSREKICKIPANTYKQEKKDNSSLRYIEMDNKGCCKVLGQINQSLKWLVQKRKSGEKLGLEKSLKN